MSDTHDHVEYTMKAIDVFIEKRVDKIIHLGDIISPFIPRFIKSKLNDRSIALISVLGNNDGDVMSLNNIFREYGWILLNNPTIQEIGGKKLWLMHGFDGIDFTEKLATNILRNMDVDIVLYGHTHKVKVFREGGKLLLNPGETCGYLTHKPTIAVLDLESLDVEIIELK